MLIMRIFPTPLFVFLISTSLTYANESHDSIYTQKIKRIVNAIDLGDLNLESDLIARLKTSCERNQCSPLEIQTIQNVGQQLILCRVKHLKAHGIINQSAITLCNSKQVILGCDTLATPLFRKMCYSGNNYSLSLWKQKEAKFKSRRPASEPEK